MDFEDATEEVMLAAGALRMALEAYAAEWRERHGCQPAEGSPITTDLCPGSAYGLFLHLRERFPDAEWRVDGGWGIEAVSLTMPDGTVRTDLPQRIDTSRWPGGMMDPQGVWRGHYWVAGRLADGTEMVADITADQFGYSSLVIEPATDPRYRSNVRKDLPDFGLSEAERAFGHGLDWCFHRDWAVGPPGP